MKLQILLVPSFLALVFQAVFASAQAAKPADSSIPILPGVVVEAVAKNSEAEKAGIREGDIILSWERGDTKGEIQSPFDLTDVETEQAPLGTVKLEGLRGTEKEKKIWRIGEDTWGMDARPQLPEGVKPTYVAGRKLAKAGRLTEAAGKWQAIADQLNQSRLFSAGCWLQLRAAGALNQARQWKQSDAAYERAVHTARQIGPAAVEQVLRTWADKFASRRDLDAAEARYRGALAEGRKARGDTLSGAIDLDALGTLFIYSNASKSDEAYRQALAIRQRIAPESLATADSLRALGRLAVIHGSPAAAEEFLLQSLAVAGRVAPGTLHVAKDLHLLGEIAGQRVDLVNAEKYLRQAIETEERLQPGGQDLALALNDLGSVFFERGDLDRAEECYRRDLAIMNNTDSGSKNVLSTISLVAPVNNLGNVALARGDLVQGKNYYLKALKITNKFLPGSLVAASQFDNLGDVDYARGNLAGARSYYQRALGIRKTLAAGSLEVAETLNSLADVAREQGDLVEAEKHYREALDIRQKRAPGSTLYAETLASLAGVMRRRHQPEMAAPLFSQALDALESQTARLGGGDDLLSGFRAKHASFYQDYIDLLVTQRQFGLAFEVLERSRARGFLETLAVARVDIRKGVDPELLKQERSLQETLGSKLELRTQLLGKEHTPAQSDAIDKEIDQLLAQYNDLEGQIRAGSPAYAALTQPQPLSAKQVQQQLLDPGTVLLEYSLGKERSYAFVVTPASVNVYELPKRADIEKAAAGVYGFLTAQNTFIRGETPSRIHARRAKAAARYTEASEKLSRMILAPAAQQIEGKRLLIISDGALQYIPFAVLPSPEAGSKGNVPLVVGHEIINLPSASTLAVLRREVSQRKAATKSVIVLADPVFDSQDTRLHRSAKSRPAYADSSERIDQFSLNRSARDVGLSRNGTFSRLPFTRREAETIYAAAAPGDATEALDFDASKATATSRKLGDYRIVHLATHGLLNSEHPELSGLVFSLVDRQGQSQDGFLRLLDIYNLELNADLVVLSACQTALGKQIDGEGLIGLARGFMYAGSPRVMASLWKVDDEATAELMKKFYEGVLRNHQTPAQALRSAQSWMQSQRRWKSPRDWAGFILLGEWK